MKMKKRSIFMTDRNSENNARIVYAIVAGKQRILIFIQIQFS